MEDSALDSLRPEEMGTYQMIFHKRVQIYSYDDVNNFQKKIPKIIQEMENEPLLQDSIKKILDDNKILVEKANAESMEKKYRFKSLYYSNKKLLDSLFPNQSFNYLHRNCTLKSKEEIIMDIMRYANVNETDAKLKFEEFSNYNFVNILLRKLNDKYYLRSEEDLKRDFPS